MHVRCFTVGVSPNRDYLASHHSSMHDAEHSPAEEKSPTQRVHDALDTLKTQHAVLSKSIQTLAPLLDVGQTMRNSPLPITAEEEENNTTPVTSSPSTSFFTPAHSRKRTSIVTTTTTRSDSVNEWFDADSDGAEEFVLDIPPAQLDSESRQPSKIASNDSRSSLGHSSANTDIVGEPTRASSESTVDNEVKVVRRVHLPAAPVGDEGSLFTILKKNVGKVRVFTLCPELDLKLSLGSFDNSIPHHIQ